MKWWVSCCDQGIFEVDKREYMVGIGAWRQMSIQGGRWDPLGRTEVMRAALVKMCMNAEPAFDISEQEAFEGRISLLMQELGEGEDHQCKGEAANRFWVVLLIKNFEKEKIQTKNITWTSTSVLRVVWQSWHNWKMQVFLMRGKYSKTVPCINYFSSLRRESRKCNVCMWDLWSMAKFFLQTVYNGCTYIIAYPSWSFHEDVCCREPFIWLIFICTLIPSSVPLQTVCAFVPPFNNCK